MYPIVNPLMAAVLRSPLHTRISGMLGLITFTGRHSGKRFTTPIGYQREGQTVWILVHRPWWKNMHGGAPVSLRLAGHDLDGWATATDDPAAIIRHVRHSAARMGGWKNARRMGLAEIDPTREPTDAEIAYAARGAGLVTVQVGSSGPTPA